MGNLYAQGFAEWVKAEDKAEDLRLEQALAIHFKTNHYPPVNDAFIPVAMGAIELADEGMWDAELVYPNGLTRTVAHTIEGLHLDAFLDEE